jgi:putative hemolysin
MLTCASTRFIRHVKCLNTITCLLAFIFSMGLPAVASSAGKTALPAGFIALSETQMSWADAKAWCQQQGGRLPLVNNGATYDGRSTVSSIDGFGSVVSPWPQGLPGGRADGYWTGTAHERRDGELWFVVNDSGKAILISDEVPALRTLCVAR